MLVLESPLLLRRRVPIAQHPRDLPGIAYLPPDHREPERAAVILPVFLVAKTVLPDLHRAVILDRIDLEASRHQIPADIGHAGKHLLKILGVLPVISQAA